MSDELAVAVMGDLDTEFCIRTVPEVYLPATERALDVCRCRALGGLEHAPGPGCPQPPR